ncbi:hypothetical protein [Bailinhaonella thermotolerans]|uniref:hypothetical protein n=1 Tax=Bailinhaonella thermotolerans TaxID=1070861 RepID=UPI00192A3A05|nr:hypothetical protein [Bailinhaonella thermotolerans]
MQSSRSQAHTAFWWCLLVGWAVCDLVTEAARSAFPEAMGVEFYSCTAMTGSVEEWRWAAQSALWQARNDLELARPVLLAGLAWLVVRRGRPAVHLWAAGGAAVMFLLPGLLAYAAEAVDPYPPDAYDCDFDPDTGFPWTGFALTMPPLALAVAAAWSGVRRDPLPRVPWRPVGAAVAVIAVLAGGVALAVRLTPAGPPSPPAVAKDGTPRHALVVTGVRLAVLDVERGEEVERLSAPDPRVYRFTAVARDTSPGRYYAAATDSGDGYGKSYLYRVTVDGDGSGEIRERVGPEVEGVITDLAVSPDGRIARWSVEVDEPGGTGTARLDLIDPRDPATAHRLRTGPASTFRDPGDTPGLYWADARTLGLTLTDTRTRVAEIDVDAPGAPHRDVLTPQVMGQISPLHLPDRAKLLVTHRPMAQAHHVALHDRATGEPTGVVYSPACGEVAATTLDPSGRHLLIGVRRTPGTTYSPGPHPPTCDQGPTHLLYRADLTTSTPAPTTPAPHTSPRLLGHPIRPTWQTEAPITDLAW